jgi:hypothetical protein
MLAVVRHSAGSGFSDSNSDNEHASTATARWTPERANRWYADQPWLVGCNYIPSTAINQLEMWQPDTFDPVTINRELGWAHNIGFNTMRVFLHDIPWRADSTGFLQRIDRFLSIADKHQIRIMFVLFDSVWDPFPKPGPQPTPRPGVMGSAWVQSPGADILKDPAKQDELKGYVTGVLGRFKDDKRVIIWDIMNEPDNPVPQYKNVELPNKAEAALQLLRKAFAWAREVNPSQPLTTGVWLGDWADPDRLKPMEQFQLNNADVITFHTYDPLAQVKQRVHNLRRYGRPLICTEYMARPLGSTFDPVMGYFASQRIGAYNWGFVLGKTQTNYPWDSWEKTYTEEPKVWFHDILRTNGTPYSQDEIDYIKSVVGDARTSYSVTKDRPK